MKVFKKIIALSLILITIVALTACDFSAKQYEPSEESYFTFTQVNGGYAVGAKDVNNLPEKLNLPEEYNGELVVAVAENGFEGASVKEIAISKNIKVIGANAFNGSTVESIYFFTGVEIISDAAFFGCSNLKDLHLPKSVTTLGKSAFASCTSIKSVILPEKVATVDSACFAYCLSLDKVYIPRSVRVLGESVFVGCADSIQFEISAGNEYYKLDENGYPIAR